MKEDNSYKKPKIKIISKMPLNFNNLNWLWTQYQCRLIDMMNVESFSKKARQELFDMFLIENGREDLIGKLHCL